MALCEHFYTIKCTCVHFHISLRVQDSQISKNIFFFIINLFVSFKQAQIFYIKSITKYKNKTHTYIYINTITTNFTCACFGSQLDSSILQKSNVYMHGQTQKSKDANVISSTSQKCFEIVTAVFHRYKVKVKLLAAYFHTLQNTLRQHANQHKYGVY